MAWKDMTWNSLKQSIVTYLSQNNVNMLLAFTFGVAGFNVGPLSTTLDQR